MNRIIGAVVLTFVIGVAVSAQAEIKEGKWTMTIVTKMAGMESHMAEMQEAMANMTEEEKAMMQQMMGGMNVQMGGEGMSTTTTQCITNDNPVPQSPEEGCTSTHTADGDTVKFETTCPESTSTGEVTYSDESMSGTIQSHSTVEGENQDVTIEISGEYVGPCSES